MKQNYVFSTINNQNFNATNTTNESIKTQSLKIFFYKKSNFYKFSVRDLIFKQNNHILAICFYENFGFRFP